LQPPKDRTGRIVVVGARVRLLGLSGGWFDALPTEEKQNVLSMIGEVFEIEEIDEYGQPWVRKSWHNEAEGKCNSHSIALESHEMELVDSVSGRGPR
jgi:hypothetical protein